MHSHLNVKLKNVIHLCQQQKLKSLTYDFLKMQQLQKRE